MTHYNLGIYAIGDDIFFLTKILNIFFGFIYNKRDAVI